MKIGALLTINSIIAFAFGIGFAVAPVQVLLPYAVELPVPGLFLARLFGAALIGYGILTWKLRAATDAATLQALAVTLFVSDALGALIAAWMVLSKASNALGWSTVAIYGLLAAGYAMHALRKPAAEPSVSAG